MTNKKLKMAAMSVALTACVAASPLAANADAPEAAPEKTEPVAEETKKEENTAEPQVNQEAKNAQETLKDAEVKYNKDNPTTNPDGSQKLDGVIVTNPEGSGETDPKPNPNPNPDSSETKPGGETGSGETGGETGGETDTKPGSGETNPKPNPDSGETDPKPNPDSGETDPKPNPDSGETNPNPNPDSGETDPNPNPGSGETDTKEKKPEEVEIGTAEKTEKSETTVETKTNPGAEPIVDTNTPPTVEKNPDGSTTITQPTVTPGTETTTTTGTGTATGDLDTVVTETPKEKIDLEKELGKVNPDISWDIEKGADAVNGYKVEEVTNTPDGNQQTLKLRKEEKTTAEMTAEDIAKLVDAEKPTVNPDGTYTLTRTETILDAEGNPQTRTTYITIRDNKVTTKTTTELTITRKKAEQDGSESFRDEMTYPSIQIKDGDKVVETIQPEDLEKMLNKGTAADDGIHFTKDDKEYVIQVGPESAGTPLSNAEIVDRLKKDGNKNYELGADGEIYYTTPHNEKVKLDVTQNELLRRSLTYTVTLTTTKKGDPGTAGEKIATEKAKKDAIRSALTKAVDKLGIEDETTAAQLKAKISDLKFTQEQLDKGDTFTAEIGGKTYTLTYSAAGATVTSTPTEDKTDTGKKPEDITDVYDNTVTGTAYVTGSKITYQHGAEYKTTGMDTLGIGADFTTAPGAVPGSIQTDTAGRITSYKDAAGNTHSFTYESVDLSKLTEAERAALEKAAKQEGWKTENLTASLTRVSWKVESPRIETPQTTPIEDGKTVNLVNDNNWSQTDHGDTVDFTHDNTTYTGMTLENESGNVKTYKKTEANGTVTIITVTTRQLDIKAQFDKKFGEGKYEMNAAEHTVTYTGEDGKTYKAKYQDKVEELAVEVQKPDVVAATGSTDAEAEAAFRKKLEKALKDAEDAGETLVIEYTKDGKIETLTVTKETKWEEISKLVGHVVNYNAMTDAELTTYLKELEKTAQEDGKYYTGSTDWDGTPYYWDDASGKMQRVPPEKKIDQRWYGDYVIIDGEEHRVHYNRNDIDHLDLATDSHLTLSEKEKDGKAKTDDCVLLNPTLKWSESAETLVKGGGTQANFVDRITYDHENDNNPSTGHYEYPRASWDEKTSAKDDNAPTKSVFYKVEGKVAYGKLGDAYEKAPGERGYAAAKQRAEADLKKYIADHPELDLSKAQVVEIYKDQTKGGGKRYYQIYLYQSDLTAYGYMTRDANVCANATASKGSLTGWYAGGYDLKISKLVQVRDGQVVGENQSSIKTLFAPVSVRSSSTKTNSSMTVGTKTTSTPVEEWATAGYGTQTDGEYKYDVDREKERSLWQFGYSDGSYKSFTNLIQNIFKGEDTGTVEGGFIKYEYHTEKDKEGNPVPFEAKQMVVTTKQDAEVHYTFTSQESRDVWIKGYTQTVVPPVNPGPDTPELPPVEDAKPAPAPAPAPETPVLPAVQDAKLIQTGTSGWLADLMLGAGMVLSAAGYWMERKRKAMFYKSQH